MPKPLILLESAGANRAETETKTDGFGKSETF